MWEPPCRRFFSLKLRPQLLVHASTCLISMKSPIKSDRKDVLEYLEGQIEDLHGAISSL